jgi:hypothetical protein
VTRVCEHVPAGHGFIERFTGAGVESELLCEACAANGAAATLDANDELVARVRDAREGAPQVIELASELALELHDVEIACPALTDLKPFGAGDRSRWLGLTADGRVVELDLDRREARELARVAIPAPLELHVSSRGEFVAVVAKHGTRGEIVELATDRRIAVDRAGYHEDVCRFPFAFVAHRGRDVAIFAPEWNRLAAFDLRTGEALTARPTPASGDRHYIDYFHCGLDVSPGGTMIADNGWVWQPLGVIATWNLERWLDDNVWESEDGLSRRDLDWREDWDVPLCWLDDTRLAIAGHGDMDRSFPTAIDIVDARTGKLVRWFAGPDAAELAFDRVLFSLGEATTVWDVERGGGLLRSPHRFARYHAGAKQFAALPSEGRIAIGTLRGLDANAAWATDRVRAVAASIDDPEAQLGILGDALDDAGCTDDELLAHCRKPGPHGRHCWALDRLARR